MDKVNENQDDLSTFQTPVKEALKNNESPDDKETKKKQEHSNIYQSQQLLDKYVQDQESCYHMTKFTP